MTQLNVLRQIFGKVVLFAALVANVGAGRARLGVGRAQRARVAPRVRVLAAVLGRAVRLVLHADGVARADRAVAIGALARHKHVENSADNCNEHEQHNNHNADNGADAEAVVIDFTVEIGGKQLGVRLTRFLH